MARTWRRGHFGLSVLNGINRAFNTVDASFDNNLTGNFTDITKTTVNDIEIPDVAVLTYSPVTILKPSYTDITYAAVSNTEITIDKPTYKDVGTVV
tara:strand:+ start:5874 stop:6161 length:288 start_codon:yes stop_codon:yes gene_type:complete